MVTPTPPGSFQRMTAIMTCWMSRVLLLAWLTGIGLVGCSGTAPNELTQEQLDAQVAEDKASLAAEDAVEAAQRKKNR